ncbi:lysozyme inhibitor LprI family protein [Halovulum marinum]|nr:lysozyme inhibitor LprI family protein [Halovulum marinum]
MLRTTLAILALSAAPIVTAAPAAASDIDIRAIDQCANAANSMVELEACIHWPVDACQKAASNRGADSGSGCIGRIARYWDERLNLQYETLEGLEEVRTLENPRAATSGQEAALLEMQRAWLDFRDAACGYHQMDYSRGAEAAHAHCMAVLTARQAFYLEEYVRDMVPDREYLESLMRR